MVPIDEFYSLTLEADRALMSDTTRGDPELEPFCLRIVALTENYPELRSEFVQGFKTVVNNADRGAWEIILLCMHILRWPEIREWAEASHVKCIQANDWRGEPVFRRIMDAYKDNWDEDGIYQCLRKQA